MIDARDTFDIAMFAIFSSLTICYYSQTWSNYCALKLIVELSRQQDSISVISRVNYNVACKFGSFDTGTMCARYMELNSSVQIYFYWDKLASGSSNQKVSSHLVTQLFLWDEKDFYFVG